MEDLNRKKIFLLIVSSVLLLLLMYPWIFGLCVLSFLCGNFFLESIFERVELHFLNSSSRKDSTKSQVYELDPLLHPTPYDSVEEKVEETKENNDPVTCTVCDAEDCPRGNPILKMDCQSLYGNKTHDLRIDPLLDKALARFCSSVFDFYINYGWAPFETRKQLRLTFKKLLSNFGEKLESCLGQNDLAATFTQEKIIPLVIHYIHKVQNSRKPSHPDPSYEKRFERLSKLKTQRLCRQLFLKNLPPEEQKCGLWVELCVAVLADGVLWNLFQLGRNRLPGVFLELAKDYMRKVRAASWPPRQEFLAFAEAKLESVGNFVGEQFQRKFGSQECVAPVRNENQNLVLSLGGEGRSEGGCKVPLLLDSFLDPSHDLYQPDFIHSRWRPRLEEVLYERELLYCLIQYLKGNRALEYLQAVLDESPDGNEYCKKVLQLEYLPAFCRSKFFMESLGVSQVDCALEAGNDSPGSRRKMGHNRSSSSGGGNSGIQIWKIGDPKAVDGLPLHSSQLGISQYPESEAALRRRQYSIEMVISKFIQSSMHSPASESAVIEKRPSTVRAGIDAKAYDEHAQDEVLSQVILGSCDIYDCVTETCVSLINSHTWIRPVLTGWIQHLRPCIKSYFDRSLQHQLREHLSIKTCVYLIDLITDAFQTSIAGLSDVSGEGTSQNLLAESDPTETLQNMENEKLAKIKESLITLVFRLFTEFVDPVELGEMLQDNEDEIISFFVDLLDLLVTHVTA